MCAQAWAARVLVTLLTASAAAALGACTGPGVHCIGNCISGPDASLPDSDAGSRPDAAAPEPGLDAGGPDAGVTCSTGQTKCGTACCDDASQTCNGAAGSCEPKCTPCGADCCLAGSEECSATGSVCLQICTADEKRCGTGCCDNAKQTCSATTSTCEARPACPCSAGQVCCESDDVCVPDGAGVICPVPSRYSALAALIESERVRQGVPGISVAIVENGTTAWTMGFGRAGMSEVSARANSQTLYRSLALGVMLTRLAALQMVDQGKMGLDGKLVTYVPGLTLDKDPNGWLSQLTIGHLLAGASGLPTDPETYGSTDKSDAELGLWLTRTFKTDDYFVAPPGRLTRWANSDTRLLANATEKVGGAYFRAAVKDRLLTPLGMARTFYLSSDALAAGNAAYTEFVAAEQDRTDLAPLAGPYASAEDSARLLEFFLNGDAAVLSDALRLQALQAVPGEATYGERNQNGLLGAVQDGYCAGAYCHDLGWRQVIQGGSLAGWQNLMIASEEKRSGLVLQSNAPWEWWPVLAAVFKQLGATDQQLQPIVAPEDPAGFSKYVGTYAVPAEAGWDYPGITVTLTGQKLHMKLDPWGGAARECDFVPLYEHTFSCTLQSPSPGIGVALLWPEVYFAVEPTGAPEYLVTSNFTGKRVP